MHTPFVRKPLGKERLTALTENTITDLSSAIACDSTDFPEQHSMKPLIFSYLRQKAPTHWPFEALSTDDAFQQYSLETHIFHPINIL